MHLLVAVFTKMALADGDIMPPAPITAGAGAC